VALLRLAVRDDDGVVGRQRDPRIDGLLGRQVVLRPALAHRREAVGSARRAREGRVTDDQRAAALDERLARELLIEHLGHGYFPPFAITAAAF
jgi:hypothetical protein